MNVSSKSVRFQFIIGTETELPSNISISLSVTYDAETQRAEGQFRRLISKQNKPGL